MLVHLHLNSVHQFQSNRTNCAGHGTLLHIFHLPLNDGLQNTPSTALCSRYRKVILRHQHVPSVQSRMFTSVLLPDVHQSELPSTQEYVHAYCGNRLTASQTFSPALVLLVWRPGQSCQWDLGIFILKQKVNSAYWSATAASNQRDLSSLHAPRLVSNSSLPQIGSKRS